MMAAGAGKPSLMELKRQQWAKEREEAKSEFYPWGRPGGGAPLRPFRASARSDSRLADTPNSVKTNNPNYLPPLNWQTPPTPCPSPAPPLAPPPHRHRSPSRPPPHTDGETSGYHSDNHLIDPSRHHHAGHHHHHHRERSSSRSRTIEIHHPADNGPQTDVSARADYKFLERRKWVQDGTSVPYDLYPECLPQIYEVGRTPPPRWVQAPPSRPHNATVQTEPIMTDDAVSHAQYSAIMNQQHAAPTFLRGQNVVVDAAVMAEREMRRAKATELQKVLLQQLAEKEEQKQLERKRQMEEERRQEEELQRQLEMERRQIEEERRRIQEKKEAEERRLEAVKEAIAGAQQNALAEKMAKRKAVIQMQENSPTTEQQVMVIHHPPATSCSISPAPQTAIIPSPRIIPPSANPRNVMMDAEVQTDQLLVLKVPCHCDSKPRDRSRSRQDNNQRSGGEDRPNTQMSMIAVKSQSTSNSNTPVVRPLWGAHQSTAKYKSQTEKDPRFLQRRRERLRRRQKLLLEKQLHGSWPSSENSGSREDVMAGDTFFPFLTSGSGAGANNNRTEKYYEALQAAAVGRSYYKKPPAPPPIVCQQRVKPICMKETVEVELLPPPPPPRSSSRMVTSPPVPALLKKMKLANGELSNGQGEKLDWEGGYESSPMMDNDAKLGKDLENLQIKEQKTPASTEQDKQDLLFRLSLLKQGLERKKTALDNISLVSSQ